MRKLHLSVAGLCTIIIAGAGFSLAETYGNTVPFESVSDHSANYVLGVQVEIPVEIQLQSFGMMYGHEDFGIFFANAIFGVYSSGLDNQPDILMAVTGPIYLDVQMTYDNIPFTSSPVISAGTYWMMALYESQASPRYTDEDVSSIVAYWSNDFASGMPGSAPDALEFGGQNFNYWVNGDLTATQSGSWSSIKMDY